jgi:hypothetical protein
MPAASVRAGKGVRVVDLDSTDINDWGSGMDAGSDNQREDCEF